MTVQNAEIPSRIQARVAGFLYLLIIVFGISSEVFVRSSLIVAGDPTATATNIMANEWLFRTGFVFDSIMLFSDVAIAVLFYFLFKPVSKMLALTATAFRLTQAAILGLNLLNYYAVLILLDSTRHSIVFDVDQLHAFVLLFLEMHSHGYDLGLLFFGVSNLILGYLVIKSGFFMKILGYGLIGAAVVYLIGGYIRFLLPGYAVVFAPAYIVPLIAELSFCIWLMVKKTDARPVNG